VSAEDFVEKEEERGGVAEDVADAQNRVKLAAPSCTSLLRLIDASD